VEHLIGDAENPRGDDRRADEPQEKDGDDSILGDGVWAGNGTTQPIKSAHHGHARTEQIQAACRCVMASPPTPTPYIHHHPIH